jgi:hypothetical protein
VWQVILFFVRNLFGICYGFTAMHVRVLGAGILTILVLGSLAGAAYTDYEKTDYLGPDALPTVNEAMNLNAAIAGLTKDITDFGPSSFFKSGDDWAEESDALKKQNAVLYDQFLNAEVGSQQRVDLADQLVQNHRLITKANKLSIIKYSEDNTNGKNDNKISRRHLEISENLDLFANRWNSDHRRGDDTTIDKMSLAALEAATEADITNVKAWDARIQMLQDMGKYDEAEQVKDEMNSRVGASALGALLALSPFTVIIGVIIACLGILVVPGRRRVLSAGHP